MEIERLFMVPLLMTPKSKEGVGSICKLKKLGKKAYLIQLMQLEHTMRWGLTTK